jgi:hypothetical protein
MLGVLCAMENITGTVVLSEGLLATADLSMTCGYLRVLCLSQTHPDRESETLLGLKTGDRIFDEDVASGPRRHF